MRKNCCAIAGGGLHANSGVVGEAEQADLHSGDASTGRAFHQYFEIGGESYRRAQQCAEKSTNNNGRETNAEHDTLLYTRKGFGDVVRAGLLADELRLISRTAAGPSRLHSGLAPRLAYSCAAARGLPPPPSSADETTERANIDWQGAIPNQAGSG